MHFWIYVDLRRFLAGSGLVDSSPLQSGSPLLSPTAVGMPRTTTVEFAPTVTRHYVPATRHGDGARDPSIDVRLRRQFSRDSSHSRRYPGVGLGGQSQVSLTGNPSQHAPPPIIDHTGPGQTQTSSTDFGGFPMPHKLLGMLFRRLFPGPALRLGRTVTIPTVTALSGGEQGRTASISGAGHRGAHGSVPEGSRPVAYISFDAVVGRNSDFQMLTNEQLEELGGVEYRGLNALLWLVAVVSDPISGNTYRLNAMKIVPLWKPAHLVHRYRPLHGHAKVGRRFRSSCIDSTSRSPMVSLIS